MKKTIYSSLIAVLSLCVSCNSEQVEPMLTDLEISPAQINIVKGQSSNLTLTFTPENITDKSAVWTSSNEAVATVSADGLVTAVECGNAVISAVSSGIMATCNVNVVSSVAQSITLNISQSELYPQESLQLQVESTPADADLSSLEWSTSNEAVATVDQSGNVMAVSVGEADITATVGEASAVCKVTVKARAEVGDFFYSDGTWSSQLDESKTVVGVVFYAGNPAKDDKILSSEHPQCVNGLAVALTESTSKFQPEFNKFYKESEYKTVAEWADEHMPDYESIKTCMSRGDNGNFMLGYSNTEVLSAFNADEYNAEWKLAPIEDLDSYRTDNELPSSTSGWYMPSVKELHILRDGETDYNIFYAQPTMSRMNEVNNSLGQISGAQLLGQGAEKEYWSSTAYNKPGWFCFNDFKIPSVPAGQPGGSSNNTNRYIFAF